MNGLENWKSDQKLINRKINVQMTHLNGTRKQPIEFLFEYRFLTLL